MAGGYCPVTLVAFEEEACDERKFGGSYSLGVLKPGHAITDFTSVAQYNTAIAAGNLVIAKNLRWEMPRAEAVTVPSFNGAATQEDTSGYNYTVNVFDHNSNNDNDTAWAVVNNGCYELLLYNDVTKQLYVIDEDCRFEAPQVVHPQDRTGIQMYEPVITFTTDPDKVITRVDNPPVSILK